MNRILELAGVLQESAEAKLYVADPYGNGYSAKPVKKGEVLTREDGNFVDFVSIHPDMKNVYVMCDGKKIKVSLKDIGGKVVQAGEKVQESRMPFGLDGAAKGFADLSIKAKDLDVREKLISQIEGHTGTLESVPYSKISTEDLRKILAAFKN